MVLALRVEGVRWRVHEQHVPAEQERWQVMIEWILGHLEAMVAGAAVAFAMAAILTLAGVHV